MSKQKTNLSLRVKSFILSAFLITTLFSISTGTLLALKFLPLEDTAPWSESINEEDPGSFFKNVFNTALAVAATLAVLMIMFGGIKYMTTDAWSGKEEAKDIIVSAIQGLILALASWLILYIINPDILNIRI